MSQDGRDLRGNAFVKVVFLDGNRDCAFGVEVNTMTAGKEGEWYPVVVSPPPS